MRILLIVHGIPPAASGGTEVYVHDLARALAASTDDVAVLTRDADAHRPELSVRRTSEGRLTIIAINNTFQACATFEESYANPALLAIARGALHELRPDVVHVQHLTCLSTGLLAEIASRRIPLVMTLNDYWLVCHRGQLLDRDGRRCDGPFGDGCARCLPAGALASARAYRAGRMVRALPLPGAAAAVHLANKTIEAITPAANTRAATLARLRHMQAAASHVDRFLAPSRTIAEKFAEFGLPAGRVVLCNQGIALSPFDGLERTRSAQLRLGFAGGLIPSKGPHVLLDAVARLPPGSVTVDLFGGAGAYHGDDEYAAQLEPWLELPSIRRLGPVPHDRMPAALNALDVLVVPSVWIENAPFIIREAFAARAPVVASDLGGMSEMVRDGVDGLLFPAGNPAALAACLQRLIAEPGLLDRLRDGIRRPMSIEEDAAALRRLYVDLLSEYGCDPLFFRLKAEATSHSGFTTQTEPFRLKAEATSHSGFTTQTEPFRLKAEATSHSGFATQTEPFRLQAEATSHNGRSSSGGRGESRPKIAAVVLNFQTPRQTALAVRSLQTSFVRPSNIFVVDNGSEDGSVAELRASLQSVDVIATGANLGFSGGCNAGIRAALSAGAEYVLLVNSDAVLAPDAIERLGDAMDSDRTLGVAGPVLLSREEPDQVASAGITFSARSGRMRHRGAGRPIATLTPGRLQHTDAVSGCVMLIRREVFARAGLLDEDYFFSFEDIDFCLRAKDAGFRTACVQEAVAYHEGGGSIGRRSARRVYFATRNHLRLAARAGEPAGRRLRSGLVLGLNAAYVLVAPDAPLVGGLAALARGAWHHFIGRYGAD